jgi:Mg2+/citrate symporter
LFFQQRERNRLWNFTPLLNKKQKMQKKGKENNKQRKINKPFLIPSNLFSIFLFSHYILKTITNFVALVFLFLVTVLIYLIPNYPI